MLLFESLPEFPESMFLKKLMAKLPFSIGDSLILLNVLCMNSRFLDILLIASYIVLVLLKISSIAISPEFILFVKYLFIYFIF